MPAPTTSGRHLAPVQLTCPTRDKAGCPKFVDDRCRGLGAYVRSPLICQGTVSPALGGGCSPLAGGSPPTCLFHCVIMARRARLCAHPALELDRPSIGLDLDQRLWLPSRRRQCAVGLDTSFATKIPRTAPSSEGTRAISIAHPVRVHHLVGCRPLQSAHHDRGATAAGFFADCAKERQPPYGVAVNTRQVALPPT
jgi:hypothetical protein